MTGSDKQLARLCRSALKKIPADKDIPFYHDQLNFRLGHELKRIRAWGLAPFLLFAHELKEFLIGEHIVFSLGLGHESSSLVAHFLGLAPLEPVHNRFIFERLLYEKDKDMLSFLVTVECKQKSNLLRFIHSRFPAASTATTRKTFQEAATQEDPEGVAHWHTKNLQAHALLTALQKLTGIYPFGIQQHVENKYLIKVLHSIHSKGIPFFESPVMRKMLKAAKVRSVDDLICLWALDQPWIFEKEFVWDFIQNKEPLKGIINALPDLQRILADSRGMLVFQEQTMWLARELASFSWLEANRLRRALGMRIRNDNFFRKFVRRGLKNGFDRITLEKIFQAMFDSVSFSCSKASAAAHVDLTLKLAYFRIHHPRFFNEALKEISKETLENPLVIDLTAFVPLCRAHFCHAK